MNLYEIVKKLVGPIEPTGEHNADQKRMQNLKAQLALMEKLHMDIESISSVKHDRHMASVKAIRCKCDEYLELTCDWCYDYERSK